MESVFLLLVWTIAVLVVALTAGAMWLYPEIHVSVRVAGARFDLRGWRPSLRGGKRHPKGN